MVPAIAHKGVYRWRCCVRGHAAHSSLTPQSVNAIEVGARVIGKLADMTARWRDAEPRYEGFDVPYSTGSVGVVAGGIADNVVPADCRFHYEFRNLPGTDAPALQREVATTPRACCRRCTRSIPEAGIRFETFCEMPAFLAAADDPAVRLAQRLAAVDETTLVAFGTEAGLFQRAGMPTVVCGPGHIAQAHQADEYVSLAQLAAAERFLLALTTAARGGEAGGGVGGMRLARRPTWRRWVRRFNGPDRRPSPARGRSATAEGDPACQAHSTAPVPAPVSNRSARLPSSAPPLPARPASPKPCSPPRARSSRLERSSAARPSATSIRSSGACSIPSTPASST